MKQFVEIVSRIPRPNALVGNLSNKRFLTGVELITLPTWSLNHALRTYEWSVRYPTWRQQFERNCLGTQNIALLIGDVNGHQSCR
jgi:hypothetical protein